MTRALLFYFFVSVWRNGRRGGFRIHWFTRAGSSPAIDTIIFERMIHYG